jgi:hypothetical protein
MGVSMTYQLRIQIDLKKGTVALKIILFWPKNGS